MALVRDYFQKTKEYSDQYGDSTIVLMQVGAFFEVYGLQHKQTGNITGSRIELFSTVCDLHIADKKITIENNKVLMAGFSHYMIDKYLKKLQEAGCTIVVFTQDEQAKNTTRSLSGIYSPGTFFSLEASQQMTNNTTCLWFHAFSDLKTKQKQLTIGIANMDIYTGKPCIFECQEQFVMSPTTFDEIERFCSIHRPSELILIGNITEEEMDSVLHLANIECNSIHKINTGLTNENAKRAHRCEKQNFQKTILETFYHMNDFDTFYQSFYEHGIATQAFCFLLDFIYQHNPNLVKNIAEPIVDNHTERLLLANHSLKQLHIIDDGTYSGQYSSVEKFLNQSCTPMGKRKFARDLYHPTTNIKELRKEYDMTEHLLLHRKEDTIRQTLLSMKDLQKMTRQMILKKLPPKSLCQLNKCFTIVGEMSTELAKDIVFNRYLRDKVGAPVYDSIPIKCQELSKFLQDRVDLALCADVDTTQQFETNFIKAGFHLELDKKKQLYCEATHKLESIRMYLHSLILSCEKKPQASSDYVKLHETEKNSFSLLATKRRCQVIKERIQKYSSSEERVQGVTLHYLDDRTFQIVLVDQISFHTQTASNDGILHPMITELCKTISSVKIEMKDLITDAYYTLMDSLTAYQSDIQNMIDTITFVDVAFTKAHIAKTFHYCKPEIVDCNNGASFVDARQLRHCLLEHLQKNELYVSNDMELGRDKNGVLLYGTNSVGKTSFIRAMGIAVIMAQAGLYVPCSSFQFFPYQSIFTRILGNDNMFKHLSSFAVEMYELRTILRLANQNSLVLGDELCSGTESISATSIFVAGIQQLRAKQTSFLFATHLHEIVHYEEICDLQKKEKGKEKGIALQHMSVMYDRERDLLIYDRKIKPGPGDNMYGLEVCKSLHLPSDFIEAAHQIRMKYHPASGSLLSLKTSRYNSEKVVGLCEVCGVAPGKEIHHLQHQRIAHGKDGFIQDKELFHKDHLANLVSICETCHQKIHKDKNIMHKKVKTNKGTRLEPCSPSPSA